MSNHIEKIKCINCNHIQEAIVEHTYPFYTYIHQCENCEYIIMESDWLKIEENE